MGVTPGIKTASPCWRSLAAAAKAFAVSFALLLPLAQRSSAADCSRLADALARLKCFDQAADAKLPMPKGAVKPGQLSREQRIRKFGGKVAK